MSPLRNRIGHAFLVADLLVFYNIKLDQILSDQHSLENIRQVKIALRFKLNKFGKIMMPGPTNHFSLSLRQALLFAGDRSEKSVQPSPTRYARVRGSAQ
jgi:hypothetical protein